MELDHAYEDTGYALQQADAARQKGEHEVARGQFDHILKLEPECKEACLGLARTLRDMGKPEEARTYFERAIKIDGAYFQAYLGLSGVLNSLDQGTEAFDILAKASTKAKQMKNLGAGQADVFYLLGEIELELNEMAEALGFFEGASRAASSDSKMQLKIADTLQDSENPGEAVKYYKKALELDPELAHVYNRLGITYRKNGKMELAVNLYEKALTFHPQDEHLMYNLARLYWETSEFDQAVSYLDHALEINPDFEEAALLRKACKAKVGKDGIVDNDKPDSDLDLDKPESI
jgi:tetratricopeptide (TPR) repeat protein